MISTKSKRHLATGLALVGPVALVMSIKAVGLGPGSVSASDVSSAAAPAIDLDPAAFAMPELLESGDDEKARAYAHLAGATTDTQKAKNPFYYPTVRDEDGQATVTTVVDPEGHYPEVQLGAVMKGRRPLALIDGNVLQVGDEVKPGWTIHEIDTTGQTIVITNDGEVYLKFERNKRKGKVLEKP